MSAKTRILNKISKQVFKHKLMKRQYENVDAIDIIERYFFKKRGYVFRMPKPGSSVILLASGGLDSMTTWAILMKEFKLQVFPITFDRDEKRRPRERQALTFFSKLYAKQFPHLFHSPLEIKLQLKNLTIPIETGTRLLHPDTILKHLNLKWSSHDSGVLDLNASFGAFLLLPVYAKIYAQRLFYTQNTHVNTIFCSVTLSDGLLVPHQTFTALRTAMLYLCAASGDFRWQFTSAVFEKESGLYLDKSDLVRWGTAHHIPLDRSWSCYHAGQYQCGGTDCLTCNIRRKAFHDAEVPDPTIYYPLALQRVSLNILRNVRILLRPFKIFFLHMLAKSRLL